MDLNVENLVTLIYQFKFNIEFVPRGIIRYDYSKNDDSEFVRSVYPKKPFNDQNNSERFIIQIVELDKGSKIIREYKEGLESIPPHLRLKKVTDVVELSHRFETSTTGRSCSTTSVLKILI
jgi:hypothetical protein